MPLASKADRLPPQLRTALAELWFEQRYSLDQILAHLTSLARGERSMLPPELADAPALAPDAIPGRSGLHDHFKRASRLAAKMRRSRMVAETLAREMGDAGDDKMALANFQLLHTAVNDIFMAAADAEAEADGDDAPPVAIDPKAAMMLATALDKAEGAKKKHLDYRAQVRREVAADLLKKVDQVKGEAKKGGMTPEEALERVRRLYTGDA